MVLNGCTKSSGKLIATWSGTRPNLLLMGSLNNIEKIMMRLCPVVKIGTICIIIILTFEYGRFLYQLDVKNAFLYGDLKEEVYME